MYNQVTFIGYLTRDPELRTVHTNAGDVAVCNFSIAVNDYRQPRVNGETVAQFIRITVWREHAAKCHQYLAKGRLVTCTGAISHYRQEVNGIVYAGMEIQNANVVFMPDNRYMQNMNGNMPASQRVVQPVQQTAAQPVVQNPVPDYDAVPPVFNDATVIDDDNDLPF